jgi:hypothetical protein
MVKKSYFLCLLRVEIFFGATAFEMWMSCGLVQNKTRKWHETNNSQNVIVCIAQFNALHFKSIE